MTVKEDYESIRAGIVDSSDDEGWIDSMLDALSRLEQLARLGEEVESAYKDCTGLHDVSIADLHGMLYDFVLIVRKHLKKQEKP